MVNIILCMIVKNETRIIERIMTSALPIIDAYSICDTGSTDDTQEKIRNFSNTHNLKGDIHEVPWINFGHNRSQSFIKARETAERLGFDFKETYALLLDGDHILMIEPGFDKHKFDLIGYQIPQTEYTVRYHNTRFIRLDIDWHCVGVTHEYWSPKEGFNSPVGKIENPWINDKADGGCKSDKFERDISLLEKGLEDEPTNSRYMFYLAQSYKDFKLSDKSIEMYKKRMNAGGWDEEIFYSALQIARIYTSLKNYEMSTFWFLKAYNLRPIRNEPLVELAFVAHENNDLFTCLMLAKKALEIPFPKDDLLFITHSFYHEKPAHLILDVSVKKNIPIEGIEAANSILMNKKSSDGAKNDSKNLLKSFSIRPLTIPVRFMENDRSIIYTNVRMRGKFGCAIRDNQPVMIKEYESHDNFDYTICKGFQNFKQIKILEFEKVGKLAFGKVIHENIQKGAVITFNGDNIQNCDLINLSSENIFAVFYANGLPHILLGLETFHVAKLDNNGKIKEELKGPVDIDMKGFEVTGSITEYNGKYFVPVRCQNLESFVYRLVSFDKTFKNLKVSLPFTFNIDINCKITSIFFSESDMTIFLDLEDTESMVIKTPIDLLTKIYKNLWNN